MHKTLPGLPYLQWRTQYGDIVKYKGALKKNILAITDRQTVKFILEEHVFDFPKPEGVREWFRSLVGEGILVVEDKNAHTRQRKLFAPALSPSAIKLLLPIFSSLASQMVDMLLVRFDDTESNFIDEDLQWWTNRLSLDAIGLAGFSYNFQSLSGNTNPLAVSLEALTNTSDNFVSFVMKALLFSFPAILKIPSQKGRYIAQTCSELGKVAIDMWNQAKNSEKTLNRTLMSMMMQAEGAENITSEEIAAQLRTLVQAGYETVGSEMAWILYEIARCSDIQEMLRKEISAIPEPTYEDIVQEMPLLDAVVKESLRLHPPVMELTHVAKHDAVVPMSKPIPGTHNLFFTIPRGTVIQIPVNALHTDPAVWGDDAESFKPQRWLDDNAEKTKHLFSFSAGPRKCPGRYFAMLEMKILVIALLKSFRLEVIPDKPIEPFWSFVVRTRVQTQTEGALPLRLWRI